ncbi:MAG: CAP domain-containing protein [Actinomycetota bacterium]|nr:CAP domain-containing protein [Actinomycetota bacterium]
MQAPRSFGAYGVTLVLGMFGASGLMARCDPQPAPTPVPAPAPTTGVTAGVTHNVAAPCTARVNAERAKAGLAPVAAHPALNKAAELHSAEQAARNKMTHTGRNGSNAGWRISRQGYAWRTWAENVAAGQQDCATVMSAWMNSAGHRANILNPAMLSIGVGAVSAGNGTIYWTMDLAG